LVVTTERKAERQTIKISTERHINVINDCEYTDDNYSLSKVITDSLVADKNYISSQTERHKLFKSETDLCNFYGIKLTIKKFRKLKTYKNNKRMFTTVKKAVFPESKLERQTVRKIMKVWYKNKYDNSNPKNLMYLFLSFNPDISERRLSEIRKLNYDIDNFMTFNKNTKKMEKPIYNYPESKIKLEIDNMTSDINDYTERQIKTIDNILRQIAINIHKFYGYVKTN
jgi:hypothetical protein